MQKYTRLNKIIWFDQVDKIDKSFDNYIKASQSEMIRLLKAFCDYLYTL